MFLPSPARCSLFLAAWDLGKICHGRAHYACFPENNFKVDGLASSWRSLIIFIIISPLFCKEALLFMSTFPPRAGGGGCCLFLEVSFLLSTNQSSFY